ncbi:hypothetical protein CDAR_64971 [Caerostris darwini]|uniref:Uncharacterized protein n=1 Tax=Caerostris darwini TaxID=1538125 RepID=A0AAV4VYL0_9ARAC|nr:hypothetical protein CDAR_64971 [Caerostris darwini]
MSCKKSVPFPCSTLPSNRHLHSHSAKVRASGNQSRPIRIQHGMLKPSRHVHSDQLTSPESKGEHLPPVDQHPGRLQYVGHVTKRDPYSMCEQPRMTT